MDCHLMKPLQFLKILKDKLLMLLQKRTTGGVNLKKSKEIKALLDECYEQGLSKQDILMVQSFI